MKARDKKKTSVRLTDKEKKMLDLAVEIAGQKQQEFLLSAIRTAIYSSLQRATCSTDLSGRPERVIHVAERG